MVGMHMIMAYGFYKYFHGVREQRYVLRMGGGFQLRRSRNLAIATRQRGLWNPILIWN